MEFTIALFFDKAALPIYICVIKILTKNTDHFTICSIPFKYENIYCAFPLEIFSHY